MRKIIYQSTAVKAVILILAAAFCLSVWPCKLIRQKVTDAVPLAGVASSGVIDGSNYAQQIFLASRGHLDSLSLYLTEDTQGEEFTVKLINANQEQIAIETVAVPDSLPAYVTVLMDVDTVSGEPYFFRVEAPEDGSARITLGIEPWGSNPNVVAVAYYNFVPLEGMTYAADYTYLTDLTPSRALFYIGLALLFALTGLSLTDAVSNRRREKGEDGDPLITVEDAVKAVCNPLAAILILVCVAAVFLGRVSTHRLDNGFALFAIALLALVLFYGINHNRNGVLQRISFSYLREHIPDLIQSVAIAFALQACCEYVSGLYDIHHRVAERKEMFWFCLIVLAMAHFKELLRLWNLLYLIAASALGIWYFRAHDEIGMTTDDRFVLKMSVVIAVLLGLILIRTVRALCEKKLAKPNAVYGTLTAVYFASIVIFRNTRWWTVTLAVGFTLLFLNYGMWERKQNFLTNVMRGAVLQFLYMTGYALLHRPYSTYRSARYTHFFHTATITATYMTLLCAIAMVLVLSKIYRLRRDAAGNMLRFLWKELLLFGITASYLIFTMARTAYMAILVTALFAVFFLAYGKGQQRFLYGKKNVCYLLLALLVMLPVVFEVQRTVPALASSPVTYDIENYTDDTLRGRKLNSDEYMRVGRFVDVFADKILGMPEGTFDIYGEIEEFRRTHPDGVTYVPVEDSSKAGETLFASADSAYERHRAALLAYGGETSYESVSYEDVYGEAEPEQDYTNGRIDIYKAYFSQLNLTGHETMGAVLTDGEIATHAHDVYLQVAYDHGIPTGMLFVVFGIATFVMGVCYFKNRRALDPYAALPAVLCVAFGVAGLVEWVYHLSHPMSFVLLLSITPLVFCRKEDNAKAHKDKEGGQ